MSIRLARPVLSAILALSLATAAGCAKRDSSGGGTAAPSQAEPAAPQLTPPADPAAPEPVSVVSRKIIRNAELNVTVASPTAAQRQAAKIAEQHGGYLVSSDASSVTTEAGAEPSHVTVVLRVSANEFEPALDAIRRLGTHVGSESINSKDVTEEWVDLEARIKTQKKLEEQYLEISKSASKVDDLLTVQKQLAEVRGEIEKLEGRRRFLQNQVALSTITVSFGEERPLVVASASAFGRAAKHAWADVQNVGAGIVVGTIRLAGVMLPVTLLVLLPLYLVGRFIVRRVVRSGGLGRVVG